PTGDAAASPQTTQNDVGSAGSLGGAASAAPSSVLQAYPPTNSIIITASEPVYRALRTVIDSLDQRRSQVYVEALIVEVSTGLAAEFGVQWNAARNIGDGRSAFGGTNFSTTIGSNILGIAQDPSTIGNGLNLGIIQGTINI